MERLEEIKNEVAKELGCIDYESLINEEGDDLINSLVNISAKRYARECIEATLIKAYQGAKIEVSGMLTRNVSTEVYLYEKTSQTTFAERKVIVEKNSVISQFNYVLV